MRFVYLHGFASSPLSRKAVAFQQGLSTRGVVLEIPLLDEGDFEHLTVARQLAVVERLLAGEPACLLGSSMGGYLAALYAATHPEVRKLVLLAPAFAFAERWDHLAGPEKLAEWRDSGSLEVFHYGEKRTRRVHYALYAEALNLPRLPDVRQPTLILHGVNDDVVPIRLSREFAATHTNALLREQDSDHELLNVLDTMVDEAIPFLLPTTV